MFLVTNENMGLCLFMSPVSSVYYSAEIIRLSVIQKLENIESIL